MVDMDSRDFVGPEWTKLGEQQPANYRRRLDAESRWRIRIYDPCVRLRELRIKSLPREKRRPISGQRLPNQSIGELLMIGQV
jgi:hypothetical protein